jgi:hypothetical protein
MNSFIYITNYTFYNKYCSTNSKKYKTVKYDYLPIIYTKEQQLTDLINTRFLMYCKYTRENKSYKSGFIGYFDGLELLINTKQTNIEISKNIIVDNTLYKTMIQNYSLCDMSNLIFIKYNNLIAFDMLLTLTNLKSICENNNLEIVKIQPQLNCCNVIKLNNVLEYIECIYKSNILKIKNIKKCKTYKHIKNITSNKVIQNSDKEDIQDSEEEEEEEEEEDVEEEDEEILKFKIPVLWIPCKKVINRIDKTKIDKKTIIEHYTKCVVCEIIDNNRETIRIDDKKINLQIKEEISEKDIMDLIIDNYQNTRNLIEKAKTLNEFGLDENKINIIYNCFTDDIYKNTLFIIG